MDIDELTNAFNDAIVELSATGPGPKMIRLLTMCRDYMGKYGLTNDEWNNLDVLLRHAAQEGVKRGIQGADVGSLVSTRTKIYASIAAGIYSTLNIGILVGTWLHVIR